jgi:hypothetical protein
MVRSKQAAGSDEVPSRRLGIDYNWQRISIIATLISAIAAFIIAIAGVCQLSTARGTLNVLQEELRASQRPVVDLEPFVSPDNRVAVSFVRLAQSDELWQLPYYLQNVGLTPIYRLRYGHKLSNTPDFASSDTMHLEEQHYDKVVLPGLTMSCGYDEVYRTKILDDQARNIEYYRHYYVTYVDGLNQEYRLLATWKLTPYKVGSDIMWSLLSIRDLTRSHLK